MTIDEVSAKFPHINTPKFRAGLICGVDHYNNGHSFPEEQKMSARNVFDIGFRTGYQYAKEGRVTA